MTRQSIFLCLAILMSTAVIAQKDFLVTNRMDTIQGKFKVMSYNVVDRVQVMRNRKKEYYTALEISSLHLQGYTLEPVEYEKSIRMMRVLEPGYLTLYAFQTGSRFDYDGLLLKKKTGEYKEVPNLLFKKAIGAFLIDCDPVSRRVADGILTREDLHLIVTSYNSGMEAKTRRFLNMTYVNDQIKTVIQDLRLKVDASSIKDKAEVTGLMDDILDRVSRQEQTPKYLFDGLQSSLTGQQEFSDDLRKLTSLLGN